MTHEKILEEVKIFTDQAHGTQMRKYAPDRYIVHPVRVMEMLKNYTSDISVLAAALMHDVLEDTPVKREQIREFLRGLMEPATAEQTVALVEELTDIYTKEAYPRNNRRQRKAMEMERMAKTSREAQTIKYADIIDNCKEIVSHDPQFARVFLRECDALLKKMPSGNRELYEKAVTLVREKLRQL